MNKYIVIGTILVTFSFILLVNNKIEEKNAEHISSNTLNIIKENLSEVKPIVMNNDKMEVMNIEGHNYIGTIVIPSLNLELPVMEECNYENLKKAPCKYYGSIYTNDLIICGHSYKSHFKYLSNLNQNDKIVFVDANGIKHIYEVLEIEILNPKEVEYMINNNFDLTLYTCKSDGLNRLTVRCNRVNEF